MAETNYMSPFWGWIYDQVYEHLSEWVENNRYFYRTQLEGVRGPVLECACGTGLQMLPLLDLVSHSAARAGRLYGLVYPRDEWWTRLAIRVLNGYMRLRKSPFRTFVHSTRLVENLLAGLGFQRRFYRQTMLWQVVVFAR